MPNKITTYTADNINIRPKENYIEPKTDIDVLRNKRILQYPLGLGSNELDEYGKEQQYMLFKINTDTKTTALRSDVKGEGVVLPLGTRLGTGIASVGNVEPKSADPDMRIKYGDTAVDKTNWVEQKGMVRLDKVIVLPMPENHNVVTSVSYDDSSAQTLATIAADAIRQPGILGDLYTLGKNKLLTGIVNSAKADLTNENAMLAEERRVKNPKIEVMFKGFKFRRFSFNWTFAPKSIIESNMVKDIIETFRYYSLPEIEGGKTFYIFPSEFEISFMQGTRDNPNLPRITTSVLESISVDYSPNSVWATLPDGSSLATRISLNFLELELIDRTRVYNPTSRITSGY